MAAELSRESDDDKTSVLRARLLRPIVGIPIRINLLHPFSFMSNIHRPLQSAWSVYGPLISISWLASTVMVYIFLMAGKSRSRDRDL